MANEDLGQQLAFLTQMKDMLEQIPALFEKMGGAIGKQTNSLRELAGSMDEATDPSKVKDMNGALEELAGRSDKATKGLSKQQKAMMAIGVAAAGAKAGFSAFSNTLGGTINMASGLASTLMNLATGAFGALMGMWEGLLGIAQSGGGGGGLREEYEKVRAEFGNIATNEGKQVIDTFKQIRSGGEFAAKSGLSLRRVFGGIKEQMAGILELAKEFGAQFDRMADDFQNNAAELIILNKGLGLTGDALVNLTDMGRQSGETMTEMLNHTAQVAVHMGKQFGISSKTIGKNMNELMADMGSFGHLSIEALGATATYAAKLGVEIKTLSGMFDKFSNFEDAAMGAAKLAESFGMNVDAMELMNAESPAEQMDMMRQAFLETGKSLDDLSHQEKKYLAEQMNVDPNDLYKMFDPANADLSFDDMMAEAEQAQEQVSPEEAMLEVAKNIEKQFQSGMKAFKGFFDAFMQGLEMGIRRTEFFRAVMRSIREALRKVYRIGVKTGQALFGPKGAFGKKQAQILPKIKKFLGEIVEFFEKLSKNIIKLAEGKQSLGDFFRNMYDAAIDFFKSEGFQNMGAMLIEGVSSAIETLMKELPSVFDALTQFIDDILTGNTSPFAGFEIFGDKDSPINQALMKGFEAIQEAWPALEKSIMALLDKVGEAALTWASNNKMLIAKIAAVLFGPAIIAGMVGLFFGTLKAAIATLLPLAIKDLMKGFKPVAQGGSKLAETFSKGFSKASKILQKIMKPIQKGFSALVKIITKSSGAITKLGGGALKIFGTGLKKIFGPLQLIISGFKALYRFGEDVMKILDGGGSAFQKTGLIIEAFFGRILFFVMDFAASFTDLFDLIVGGILGMFNIKVPSLTEFIFGKGGPEELYNMFIEFDFEYLFFDQILNPIGEGFTNMGNAIGGFFTETLPGVFSSGVESVSKFATNVGNKVMEVPDKFKEMIETSKKYLSPKFWLEKGKNVVDGLMKGVGDLGEKFKEKAKAALGIFGKVFRLASPSKAMEEMGGMITAGLEQGTEGMENSLRAPSQKSIDKMAADISKLDTSKLAGAADQLAGITEMSESVKELSDNLNDISIGGGAKKMAEIGTELSGILPAAISTAESLQNFVIEYGTDKLQSLVAHVKAFTPPLLTLTNMVLSMATGLTDMVTAISGLSTAVAAKSPETLKTTLMDTLGEVFGKDGEGGLIPELSTYFQGLGEEKIKGLNTNLTFYAKRVQAIADNAISISENLKNMNNAWETVPEVTASALKVQENIVKLVEEIGKVNTALSGLDTTEAVVSVQQVAEGLKGDGTITVQHESLNIVFQATINIDSKELAGALSEGPQGPYFVINTGQGGGAGESESAGG